MRYDWNEYRKRRNFAIIVGFAPVVFPLEVLAFRSFHTFVPAYVLAAAWIILFTIAWNRVAWFPCPRCGKWFFGKRWGNMFARRCAHCGLRKYSDPSAIAA